MRSGTAQAYSNVSISTGSCQPALAMGLEVSGVDGVVVVVPSDQQRCGLHTDGGGVAGWRPERARLRPKCRAVGVADSRSSGRVDRAGSGIRSREKGFGGCRM